MPRNRGRLIEGEINCSYLNYCVLINKIRANKCFEVASFDVCVNNVVEVLFVNLEVVALDWVPDQSTLLVHLAQSQLVLCVQSCVLQGNHHLVLSCNQSTDT